MTSEAGADGMPPAGLSDAELAAAGLAVTISGSVATVTLSRPDRRNAMTPSMWHGLAEVGAALGDQVRVVLIKGAGPSFCAGIDLRMFSADGVPGEQRNPTRISIRSSPASRPATPGCATRRSSLWR
jgi:hypothetical protein